MCSVSMVGDHYRDMWKDNPLTRQPSIQQWPPGAFDSSPTRSEFNELKRQVEEMKLLLARAKKYDEDNGEPECEIDEKMDLLRKVAKLVGVELDDVLGSPKT